MRYLPHTPPEIEAMLREVGVSSLDQLFESIPESARLGRELRVDPPMAEPELMRHLGELARQSPGAELLSFLGAGAYAHHVPPAVDQLLLRGEFYTAYTPYQPEVSQGTLQAIWEFQTIVSELFGLPLANASLYDGGSAAAEAALMACRLTRRPRILVSGCVHPHYRDTVKTYLSGRSADAVGVLSVDSDGRPDRDAIESALGDQTAALLVGYPSFFGSLTDLRGLAELCQERGALLISVTTEPYALALAEAPGAMGVAIAVGEGQPLACPPQLGGPGVGLFACRDERAYLQQMPGRICGETVDGQGRRGYVLTLATREQHIRRERATSNICTNQGLLALSLTIRSSLLGKRGFIETATQCLAKARYLWGQITALSGYTPSLCSEPFFNEFSLRVRGGNAAKVVERLEGEGIVAGLDLGRADPKLSDHLLIAVTETHRREDLDRLVEALDRV